MKVSTTQAPASPASSTLTQGVWFGPADRPVFGWLTRPPRASATTGIVVAPPVGDAYYGSHRTLRVLAERLAAAGHAVLRIDYDGTGDSAGDQWDADRVSAWRQTVKLAVAELRRLGADRITLFGARIGATIALLDASSLGAERVVAWMPVIAGRRYVKELRMLSQPVPEECDPADPPGSRVLVGNVFTAQTLQDLQSLVLTDIERPPAPATLVIDDPAGSSAKAVTHLRAIGAAVEHLKLAGSEQALAAPPEFATVPAEIVAAACDWIDAGTPALTSSTPRIDVSGDARADISWRGEVITEEVIALGRSPHVGLLTSPRAPDLSRATLVLLNAGSEPHIGPGRAWVEYARDLAVAGRRTLRVDFMGWGESSDTCGEPGRPYDTACVPDTVAIVDELRDAGHARIAICGLCASAWIGLAAAPQASVDGVIAINPQMYWKQGDDVQIDWDLIRARRAGEITHIARGQRLHLWSLLDVLGRRPRVARWLDDLAASGKAIHFVFAEGDDGLVYLNARFSRRLARVRRTGRITVRELPGVDHPMHRTWRRPRVLQAIADALQEIDDASQLTTVRLTPGQSPQSA